jgi:hypothetical protein
VRLSLFFFSRELLLVVDIADVGADVVDIIIVVGSLVVVAFVISSDWDGLGSDC